MSFTKIAIDKVADADILADPWMYGFNGHESAAAPTLADTALGKTFHEYADPAASYVGRKARSFLDSITSGIGEHLESAHDKAQEFLGNDLAGKAGKGLRAIKDNLLDAKDALVDLVKDNPHAATIVAAGGTGVGANRLINALQNKRKSGSNSLAKALRGKRKSSKAPEKLLRKLKSLIKK